MVFASHKQSHVMWSLIRGHNRRNIKWLPPLLYHCSRCHFSCQCLLLMWGYHHPSTQTVYTHHHALAEHSSPSQFRHVEHVHTHTYTQLWTHWCEGNLPHHLEIGIVVSLTLLTTLAYFCHQSLHPNFWCEPISPGHLLSQSFTCDVSRHLMMSPYHSSAQIFRYTQQIALMYLTFPQMHPL